MFAKPLLPRKNNTYYKFCVPVTLNIQHAKDMRRIMLPYVACLAVPHFYTLSHKHHEFIGGGGKGGSFKHKTGVLIFSTTFF
jgi:hypothetical protein